MVCAKFEVPWHMFEGSRGTLWDLERNISFQALPLLGPCSLVDFEGYRYIRSKWGYAVGIGKKYFSCNTTCNASGF